MTPTQEFHRLAERVVDDLLEADPVAATELGDHRYDDRLPDLSTAYARAGLTAVDDHLAALDAIDDVELEVSDLVDLEILRARLLERRFELDELRAPTWNPMAWNPGTALHLLMSRDFAPAAERQASMRARLGSIPDRLAEARAELDEMPAIHVETAMSQFAGTRALVDGAVRVFVDGDGPVDEAIASIDGFTAWLDERLPESRRSPRLGEHLYAAALWHSLDEEVSAAGLLRSAEVHLDVVTAQIRDVAAQYLGVGSADDADVRLALDDVARSAPVSDGTILGLVKAALDQTTDFVRDRDLVEVPDVNVRVIEMPEIHRGVAVAYCDAPGPLEPAGVPTFVAVAPMPSGWASDRVASFYREYNGVQVHGLTIHEAMPGHVLQLAHAQRLGAATSVRRFGRSGVLVEGWAVYAEEMMVGRGYAPSHDPRGGLALQLQQLKMQARTTINAILDVGVHAADLPEHEALRLMRERGFQEDGEAIGKWRRALLTACQLPTYFVGYRAVSGIAHDLRVLHPGWSDRQVHDLMLSHGSPAPRHLRTLLGI